MAALEDIVEPGRVLDDLRELHSLTADGDGAQRLAWTDGWESARDWLCRKAEEIGADRERDEAGNLWLTLPGRSRPLVAIGSHLDSVPSGGRYDGALGVIAGLEVLRAAREAPDLAHGVAAVDFADEEGARFGHSLFGSTALLGRLHVDQIADLEDRGGMLLAEALAEHGVELAVANRANMRRSEILAYLELHVEQGPVLDERGIAVAPVEKASGIDRFVARLEGETTHAGATSMSERRDPAVAAATAVARIAAEAEARDGLATFGSWKVEPSIATAVPASMELTFDIRHDDAETLTGLGETARDLLRSSAADHDCGLSIEPIWRMDPVEFDPALVEAAAEAAVEAGGSDLRMTSARGHDAVVLAQQLPVAMLFTPSVRGLSHNAEERTEDDDVICAVRALARLVGRVAAGDVSPASGPKSPEGDTV